MTLEECVPQHKHDAAAIRNAEAMGFPAVDPILGELLGWIKDMNWPVAPHAAAFLRGAGPEVVPHILDVLRGRDEEWTMNILRQVAGHLRPEVWSAIAAEVERIAQGPVGSEADEDMVEAAAQAIRLQAGAGTTD